MSLKFAQIFEVLQKYKIEIEQKISNCAPIFGHKNKLSEATIYALSTGGKRFRPALVLMVAKAIGQEKDVSDAALAIEFFHTASLIADDLPCMDNDDERRNKPTVHKVFGESMALLASYGLISAGYSLIAKNGRILDDPKNAILALENASFNTGVFGATGGQFLDLYPAKMSEAVLREVVHKKTVSLFEISFVFGWIFGGGPIEKLETVKRAAEHFGLAFQIADDIADELQDLQNNRIANYACFFGRKRAIEMFHEEIQKYRNNLDQLSINSGELVALSTLLTEQVEKI